MLDAEKVPAGQAAQTRSVVGVASAAKKVPAPHVGDCAGQLVSRVSAFTDGVVVDEKVPLMHGMQTRSEMAVASAEKKVPGGQVVLSLVQLASVGVAKVEGEAAGE